MAWDGGSRPAGGILRGCLGRVRGASAAEPRRPAVSALPCVLAVRGGRASVAGSRVFAEASTKRPKHPLKGRMAEDSTVGGILDGARAARILRLAAPVIVAMLTETGVNIVDTAFIGRLPR